MRQPKFHPTANFPFDKHPHFIHPCVKMKFSKQNITKLVNASPTRGLHNSNPHPTGYPNERKNPGSPFNPFNLAKLTGIGGTKPDGKKEHTGRSYVKGGNFRNPQTIEERKASPWRMVDGESVNLVDQTKKDAKGRYPDDLIAQSKHIQGHIDSGMVVPADLPHLHQARQDVEDEISKDGVSLDRRARERTGWADKDTAQAASTLDKTDHGTAARAHEDAAVAHSKAAAAYKKAGDNEDADRSSMWATGHRLQAAAHRGFEKTGDWEKYKSDTVAAGASADKWKAMNVQRAADAIHEATLGRIAARHELESDEGGTAREKAQRLHDAGER